MIKDLHLWRIGFPQTECGIIAGGPITNDESKATCANCIRIRSRRDKYMKVPHALP